jgi:hypothetical protein
MKPHRSWGLPNEKELDDANRVIRLSGAWLSTLSMWGQIIAIPLLAGLLFFSR